MIADRVCEGNREKAQGWETCKRKRSYWGLQERGHEGRVAVTYALGDAEGGCVGSGRARGAGGPGAGGAGAPRGLGVGCGAEGEVCAVFGDVIASQ